MASFTLDQVTARLIARAHALADAWNAQAVASYQLAKANVLKWNETNPPGMRPAPLPQVPMLFIPNDNAIAADESNNSVDFSKEFELIPYVDPNPVPVPQPAAPIVVDTSNPVGPGLFRAASGDIHSVPAGFKVEQGGHTYVVLFTITLGPILQQIS